MIHRNKATALHWQLLQAGRIIEQCMADVARELILKIGDKPSKEWLLHKEVYEARPGCGAVVHLHSPHAVAVSCLKSLNPDKVLPLFTPYYVMRMGQLAFLRYYPPGDAGLAQAVGKAARNHGSILLAHHVTVVAGKDLEDAVDTSEELEETARLYLLLKGQDYNSLDTAQIKELEKRFGVAK